MARKDEDGLAGVERRRRYWATEEKRRIVAESFADGARRHRFDANLLFTWRRRLATPEESAPPAIVPVVIAPPVALPTAAEATRRMEITLCSAEKIVVGANVEATALARVVEALRR